MELLMVGICFFLLGIACFFEYRDIRRQQQLCERQAQKLDGHIKGAWSLSPKLVVPYYGYSVTIDPHGSRKQGLSTIAFADLCCARPIQFSMTQGDLLSAKALSENRRWNTGERAFDGQFTIRSTDEQFMQHLLSLSLPRDLLRLAAHFSGCSLELTDRQLRMGIGQSLKDEREYDTFLDIFFACLKQVDACTRIRTIRFDESCRESLEEPGIAVNPDLFQFEHPPFGLERLEINAAAYNFYLVERFLTCSLNTLGSAHLKNILEVAIAGNSSDIHPNLRNGFLNLCRSVIETDRVNNTVYCVSREGKAI